MNELLLTRGFLLIYLFVVVFILTLFLLPRIREVNLRLNLYGIPDDWGSHSTIVPNLGGIFFISLMYALFYSQLCDEIQNIGAIIFSLTIMFFIGFKDDLPKPEF